MIKDSFSVLRKHGEYFSAPGYLRDDEAFVGVVRFGRRRWFLIHTETGVLLSTDPLKTLRLAMSASHSLMHYVPDLMDCYEVDDLKKLKYELHDWWNFHFVDFIIMERKY